MQKRIFEHDQFLGDREILCRTQGFSVSRLVPTVPEDGVAEHAHAEAHFVLLMGGTYVSSAHGAPDEARAPILIYNPPGTVHRDRFRGDAGAFLTVAVSLAAQRRCEQVMTLPDYACAVGGEAQSVAQDMAGMLAGTDPVDDLALESRCMELMSATASRYVRMHERAPAWLLRARECLREDRSAGSLSDVAGACGVHPVYLARAFRAHFGCSPGEYQRRCRLNRAAAMLASDASSLAEVAQACGYFDQAHFSRAFADAFGMPPGRYRQHRLALRVHPGSGRTRPHPA